MITYAPTETQKAVFTLLNLDTTLQTLLGSNKIYDHVPDNSPYPYVTIRIKPWEDRGNHDFEGLSCQLSINVWYREDGRGDLEVQKIQKRIDELMHSQDICIEGWNIVSLRRSTIDILDEPDGVTKHGIQIFNLLIGEV